jgi:hypothetical protein
MSLFSPIKKLALSPYFQPALLVIICVIVTLQAVSQDEIANFVIFKTASQRLLAHQNLYEYISYGNIYDRYFYAPVFSLLFTPFKLLPVSISVFLWLLVGALSFYYAIQKLQITNVQKNIIFLIAFADLVNSLQNIQTNSLNAAFMLLIFSSFQSNKPVVAGFFTALCLSIKIYPAAAALLFLFYPNKFRFLTAAFLFTLFLFSLPLLVVPCTYYINSLQSWCKTLVSDTEISEIWQSSSLIGINYTWFPKALNHFYLQLGGLLLVFLPLLKILKNQVDKHFILLYLSLLMIFVVIFNHAAESPTYIIAVTGAAIWYSLSEKSSFNNILLVFLFIACILSPTDIFPHWLRKEYFEPLKIRVIPCVIIWVKILYELLAYKPKEIIAA